MQDKCIAEQAIIARRENAYSCGNNWDGEFWRDIPVINIDNFHARSSDHRPVVKARLAHDDEGIAACFLVQDRYVVCRNTLFMSSVCQDSCVEFFFQPGGADGYFNFEVNCGGTLHASYIRDPERLPEGGFRNWTPLAPTHGEQVKIFTNLPDLIDPEIPSTIAWCLAFFIPYTVLAGYCGEAAYSRTGWRGNLYKCADKSSHPHWAAWRPVEPLNFHQPKFFAPLIFQ